jgi:hypothetical protein
MTELLHIARVEELRHLTERSAVIRGGCSSSAVIRVRVVAER